MDIGVRQGLSWTERPDPKILGVEGAGRIAARAHGEMKNRGTTGKLLLIP